MKDGPDIARIAALIGDPARANMLTALMSGKALTATELAGEAGITPQTASTHLARMEQGGLLQLHKQGRHKYFALQSDAVADLLESLMGLAAQSGHLRTRTGPRDADLRRARVCYNHLAGDMGIQLYDALIKKGCLEAHGDDLMLTETGQEIVTGFGIDLAKMSQTRAPLCRACLDWSARRMHLAGSLGRAFLSRFEELGWAKRTPGSRVVHFSPKGLAEFEAFTALR